MRRVLVALAVVAVLVVGGLVLANRGGGPSGEERLAADLRADFDYSAELADCVASQAYDRLSPEEIELLRERDEDDELAPELRRKIEAALTPCASAGS